MWVEQGRRETCRGGQGWWEGPEKTRADWTRGKNRGGEGLIIKEAGLILEGGVCRREGVGI